MDSLKNKKTFFLSTQKSSFVRRRTLKISFLEFVSFVIIALCFILSQSYASFLAEQVVAKVEVQESKESRFLIYPGHLAEVKLESEKNYFSAHIVGRIVHTNGQTAEIAFFVPQKNSLFFINSSDFYLYDSKNTKISNEKIFPVIRSFEQVGGTCMAFTLYNAIRELDFITKGFRKKLRKDLSTEEGRTLFLVKLINEYYIESVGYDKKVINFINHEYNISLENLNYNNRNLESLLKTVLFRLDRSYPVLITFNVPKFMDKLDYEIKNLSRRSKEYEFIWHPKKLNQKSFGAHAVLGVSLFKALDGETYIVIVDPNFELLRLWKLKEFQKVRASNMNFWSVKL
jgi:hypothetical protein